MAASKPSASVFALLLVFSFSLVPGSSAYPGDNDSVTRTWGAPVLAEAEFRGGLGLYSPSNVCTVSVEAVRVGLPSVVYYQDGREVNNWGMGYHAFFGPGQIPLGQPCPLPGSNGDLTSLAVGDWFAHGPYHGLSIDQLVCAAEANAQCFVDPASASVTLFRCDDPTFVPAPIDGKGILAGTGLNGLALSRSISCGSTGGDVRYYDDGPQGGCDSWAFDDGIWGTDFCRIWVEDVVPIDGVDQTGSIVVCMEADNVLVIDATTGPPTTYYDSFASHDYLLALDIDGTPASWSAAQRAHWNLDGTQGPAILQGWNDLGGSNGCPGHGVASPPPVDSVRLPNGVGLVPIPLPKIVPAGTDVDGDSPILECINDGSGSCSAELKEGVEYSGSAIQYCWGFTCEIDGTTYAQTTGTVYLSLKLESSRTCYTYPEGWHTCQSNVVVYKWHIQFNQGIVADQACDVGCGSGTVEASTLHGSGPTTAVVDGDTLNVFWGVQLGGS